MFGGKGIIFVSYDYLIDEVLNQHYVSRASGISPKVCFVVKFNDRYYICMDKIEGDTFLIGLNLLIVFFFL